MLGKGPNATGVATMGLAQHQAAAMLGLVWMKEARVITLMKTWTRMTRRRMWIFRGDQARQAVKVANVQEVCGEVQEET